MENKENQDLLKSKKGLVKKDDKIYKRAKTAIAVFLMGVLASFFSAVPVATSAVYAGSVVNDYKQTEDYEVEVYYLYPKNEKHKRHYEIWIPIE